MDVICGMTLCSVTRILDIRKHAKSGVYSEKVEPK